MTVNSALSKAAKSRQVRRILDGDLGRVPGADAAWLITEVFCNHPHWDEKKGAGIQSVELRTIPPYNSRCFFIVRVDGSAVDISFRESLRPSTHTAKVKAAARFEIEGDVRVWKLKNPSPEGIWHCDHITPFESIWREFLEKHTLSEEHISIISDGVGLKDYFENRRLSHSWQRYHFERATFQWLTPEENIEKSNKVERDEIVV